MILLFCAASCADAGEGGDETLRNLPSISWRGEFVEFGTDIDSDVCPQTLPTMEEYVEGVSEHVRAATNFPIRYYHLSEGLRHYGFGCREDSFGCIRVDGERTIVGSRKLSLRHELIHASSSKAQHRVLEEGLATYLGTDLQWAGIAEPTDIWAAFDSVEGNGGSLSSELYPVAGHFVSFLVDEHGLEATVALVEASEVGMTLDELGELYVEHLGHDLGSDIQRYEASGPGCEAAQLSPTWFECELVPPSIPIFACEPGQDRIMVDISLSCADGAIGVDDGVIWKDVLIDAPVPELALLYLYEGHPVDFTVRGCGQGCATPFARISSQSAEEGLILDAFHVQEGLNLIRIAKPAEAPGRVRFSIGLPCP